MTKPLGPPYKNPPIEEALVEVLVNHQNIQDPDGAGGFLADIDVMKESLEVDNLEKVMAIVDDLHAREGKAFDALITDESRTLFDE